jgi:ectoine hydroxylase-related dioxygenase (phytanoyl-CoA dioxygenase family)
VKSLSSYLSIYLLYVFSLVATSKIARIYIRLDNLTMWNGVNGHHINGNATTAAKRVFPRDQPPSIEEFKHLCSRTVSSETYPLASSIQSNIPIYDMSRLQEDAYSDEETVTKLQDEWHHILSSGPGTFILKGLYDRARYGPVLESATNAFLRIIDHEMQQPATDGSQKLKGDHFAENGANGRIWNSFSKLAVADPKTFLEYYSNPWLAHVCEAWLGPAYRITAQLNIVRPGGAAQKAHRDYHLGFFDVDRCGRYPRATQVASQLLTLQGAIAHSDMPTESGPTRLLPFSQLFEAGFMAHRRAEFQHFFQENYVALPLQMGDALFFNPALFHAAGANTSQDVQRTANLLQVNSALGKTMESIDSIPLVDRCWDLLVEKFKKEGGGLSPRVQSFIQAVADGYPFPTNLDNVQVQGNEFAPQSEQDLIVRGLKEGWERERIVRELKKMKEDQADRPIGL